MELQTRRSDAEGAPGAATLLQSGAPESNRIILTDSAIGWAPGMPWELVQARHNATTFNTGYVDGHVKPLPAVEMGTTPSRESVLAGGPELKRYLVKDEVRDKLPIFHAGTSEPPYTADEAWIHPGFIDQGLTAPGWGAYVFGSAR